AGQLDFLASASVRSSDDVSLSTGNELPFSAGESWSGLAKIGWEPGPFQRVEASWNRYSRESTTPINANQPDTLKSQVADRSSLRSTATLNYRLRDPEVPGLNLDVTAYRNESKVEERRLSDDRFEVRNVVTWGLDAANTSRIEISEDVRTAVTLGTELYRDEADGSRNGESLGTFPDGTADFLGLYAQNRWTFADRVHLIPGVRWDHFHQANASEDAADSDEEEVSLKAAAEVEATQFLDLFGSWGEGFNAPRLLDLYISGLHFPSPPRARFPDNFFVSNPTLGPEKAESWETGARLAFDDVITRGDGIRADVTYFHTDAEDFIAREVNIREGTTTFRNLDRVEAEGVEARVRYEAGPVFGRASFGQVRMRNLTEEAPVNDAPADTWGLDLGARLADRALTLGYSGTLAEDQRRVTDEEFETSGYVVSDLFAGWAADEGPLSGVAVQMRLENVFDETYTRHGSFIPAPGRSLRLEITYSSGLQTP
ncbi:MAG: TonB-dependent receptor, partial [Candidatus Palauibacterales bacterium]|nr:TonB-dependent receptor [Candidatus Palauibacterales bacterium]